jgi:chromosome segregation ATPase
MADEAKTEPTIETILEEMRAGFASVERRFSETETRLATIESRLATIESQLENMDIRFDRLEGFAAQTQSEVKYLRADFKELKIVLK